MLTFKDGAVVRVDILMPGGGHVTADGFVGDRASGEARMLAAPPFGCDGRTCRTSCFAASNIRPFSRMQSFDAQDRRQWTWSAKGTGETVAFLGFAGADCLSPDGRYLTVTVYGAGGRGAGSERGPGVLKLSPTPGWARVPALESVNDGVIGWQPNAPATLIVERDAREAHGAPRYVNVPLPG